MSTHLTRTTPLVARYGPWALVTGASDGIGREHARTLARSGMNVVLVARRRDALEALARELESEHRVEAQVVGRDRATRGAVEATRSATTALDVGLLVAAAGFGTSGLFLDHELDDELAMIDLNCRAVAALTHAFGRRFVARGRGGIVLFSSIVAFQGVPRAANYAATKAYVQSFAEGLRQELAPRGVDVIASAPGPIRSGFGARANMQMGAALSPEVVATVTLAALGRMSTVRPGWLSKLLGWSLALLPRWGRTQVLTAIMAGMTKHQAS